MSDEIILETSSQASIENYMLANHLLYHDELIAKVKAILDVAIIDEGLRVRIWSRLNESDFFYAPASSKFHGNYPMGLAEHCVNVYEMLLSIASQYELTPRTCARMALFHDVCKIDYYHPYLMKKPKGVLRYETDNDFPFGHGELSIIIAMKWGIVFTSLELIAIRWHMGNYDYTYKQYEAKAKELFPAHRALQYADMMATDLETTRGRPY